VFRRGKGALTQFRCIPTYLAHVPAAYAFCDSLDVPEGLGGGLKAHEDLREAVKKAVDCSHPDEVHRDRVRALFPRRLTPCTDLIDRFRQRPRVEAAFRRDVEVVCEVVVGSPLGG
jgi:hypothetical protein